MHIFTSTPPHTHTYKYILTQTYMGTLKDTCETTAHTYMFVCVGQLMYIQLKEK